MATQPDKAIPPKSILTYQVNERLRRYLTSIRDVRRYSDLPSEEQSLFKTGSEQTYALETKGTIFVVQGGGQPFDTGVFTATDKDTGKEKKFNVEAVRYGLEGRVLHFGHFADNVEPFQPEQLVEQRIDGVRRDLNSRIHTAGHIVGLAVRKLAGETEELREVTELKAQHYPDSAFVDFNGLIDGKYKDDIQAQVTQYVNDALPVRLYWYRPEELKDSAVITPEGMPLVAGQDGKIRVVDIDGAGAYPCGGTHVPDTSFVGEIVVRNIKRQKGVSKISYAVEDTGKSLQEAGRGTTGFVGYHS